MFAILLFEMLMCNLRMAEIINSGKPQNLYIDGYLYYKSLRKVKVFCIDGACGVFERGRPGDLSP